MISQAEKNEYLNLPPDAYSRFFICKELLKTNFAKKPIKLLDVGGGSKYFYQSLELDSLPYELTVIDIRPAKGENSHYQYIQGDATKMKFKDDSFDAVVSMDVLEHVPDDKKVKFIQECYRVAKDVVIIAGPFETPETTQAETLANNFYREFHNSQDHPWLIEHFEQNKPTFSLMEKEINSFGCPHIQFASNHLPAWLQTILINFSYDVLVEPSKIQQFNRFYNKNLTKLGDFDAPGYRQFYVLYKNSALKKDIDKYFKLETSISLKLETELKAIELFSQILAQARGELAETNHKLAGKTESNKDLTTRLEATAQHGRNLEAIIKDMESSKSYQLARRLGSLGRPFKRRST